MVKMLSLTPKQREAMGKEGRKFMVDEYNEKLVIAKYLHTIKEETWDENKNKFVLKGRKHRS